MSYAMKELVKRTEIKPLAAKAVMLHLADTVREAGAWEFWEANGTTAKYLGTDRKTIWRQLRRLDDLGVIFPQTERMVKGRKVNVYLVDLTELLALPCVDERETRREFFKRLIEVEKYPHEADWPDRNGPEIPPETSDAHVAESHTETSAVWLRATGHVAESHTNLNRTVIPFNGKRASDLSDHSLSREERAEREEFERTFTRIVNVHSKLTRCDHPKMTHP